MNFPLHKHAGATMRALAATLGSFALLAALLALAPAARADFGIEPGSFVAKTHPTVPLLTVSGTKEFNRREINLVQIIGEAPVTQAGAHPDASASFVLKHTGSGTGATLEAVAKDVSVDTPAGFIGNPNAVPACSREAFQRTYRNSTEEKTPLLNGCPPASQVGVATIHQGGGTIFPRFTTAVYRIATADGAPASFGFPIAGNGIVLNPTVRSDGDYGLTLSAIEIDNEPFPLVDTTVTLWGVPASPIHNAERFNTEAQTWGVPLTGAELKSFLSNPTYCGSGPLTTSISMDSWNEIGRWLPEDPTDPNYLAESPEPTGCEKLAFGGPGAEASLSFQPVSRIADTPSAYSVKLKLPYSESPEGFESPTLRDTKVTLPDGLVVNPAAANGLAACTSAQIGYMGNGFPLPNPIHFNEEEPGCPSASKIGTVQVTTPLLEEPLQGSVYLAKQYDNPFHDLLAIYLAINDAKTGIVVKLAGHVEADPHTGRVTATFTNNPQLPFTEFALSFFGGPGAALSNPQTCGTKTTTTELTPWSAPYTPTVTSNDSFQVEGGANGAPCAASEAAEPNQPSFEAGTAFTNAASYSPFVLKLSREDGSQRLSALNVALPQGLTGKLAGVPYCPEAAITQAESRNKPGEGAIEQANPSCPSGSQVGTVRVGAGAGPSPVFVQGRAYLAGPYKGAPLSLAIVTPAVAGPLDLGTVVVRSALYVNEETAQITAKSDPLPTILEGIPLDVRSIAVSMDRPDFTLNPTSCEAMAVSGEAIATSGQVAPLSNRFQVGGCRGLDFKPNLHTRVFGPTKRNRFPRFRAIVEAKSGEANIARTAVTLPHSEFLEQGHIKTICTRVQFAEGAVLGEKCPTGSVYGSAKAFTPLLGKPLEGPVFLRANGGERELPDLVAALHGQIDINLVGFIDSVHGGIRTRFNSVPDAPVSKFILTMKGGSKGLLVNSTNLCKTPSYATVKMDGHNGKIHDFRALLKNDCRKSGKKHSRAHRRRASLRGQGKAG